MALLGRDCTICSRLFFPRSASEAATEQVQQEPSGRRARDLLSSDRSRAQAPAANDAIGTAIHRAADTGDAVELLPRPPMMLNSAAAAHLTLIEPLFAVARSSGARAAATMGNGQLGRAARRRSAYSAADTVFCSCVSGMAGVSIA